MVSFAHIFYSAAATVPASLSIQVTSCLWHKQVIQTLCFKARDGLEIVADFPQCFSKKLQQNCPKMKGGSKAIWNFSENSFVLVDWPIPKDWIIVSELRISWIVLELRLNSGNSQLLGIRDVNESRILPVAITFSQPTSFEFETIPISPELWNHNFPTFQVIVLYYEPEHESLASVSSVYQPIVQLSSFKWSHWDDKKTNQKGSIMRLHFPAKVKSCLAMHACAQKSSCYITLDLYRIACLPGRLFLYWGAPSNSFWRLWGSIPRKLRSCLNAD